MRNPLSAAVKETVASVVDRVLSVDAKTPVRPTGRKDDAALIQRLLRSEIKRCGKSGEQIAKEMTDLIGQPVTLRRLYAYTATSREDCRWPAELDLAFCEVVGSYKLLAMRVKRAGFRMVGPKEERLIAIGAAYERKLDAEAVLESRGK